MRTSAVRGYGAWPSLSTASEPALGGLTATGADLHHQRPSFSVFACLTLIGLTATISACSDEPSPPLVFPVLIDGVYDLSADFSAYQTYDLVEPEDLGHEGRPQGYIESNRVAVIQSILDELSQRGLVLDQSNPDLRISPFVRLTEADSVDELWWWEHYWGWYWGYSAPWYSRDITEFEAGTLVIDAVDLGDPADPEDDRLVFRATATGLIPTEPQDVSDQIPGYVEDMFAYWPDPEDSQ